MEPEAPSPVPTPVPERPLGRRLLSAGLRVALAAGLLAFIFSRIPLQDVAGSIAGADARWVAVSWGLTLLTSLISATRLRLAARRQGLRSSIPTILGINLASSFYGLFLPGYLAAGAVRWYKLARREKSMAGALAAIAYCRVNFFLALILVGIAGLALDARRPTTMPLAIVFAVLLGIALPLHALAFSGGLAHVLGRLFPHPEDGAVPRTLRGRVGRLLGLLGRFRDLSMRDRAGIWACSLAEHAVALLTIVALVRALGLGISVANLAWVRTTVQVVTMIPISISGLGIQEGSLIVLLAPSGIAGASAVALSLLMFSRNIFIGLLGACVEARGLRLGRLRKAEPGTPAERNAPRS